MISTADLQDWMKADDADAPVLRTLEQSAVATLQTKTGHYYGVEAEIVETIRFRGFPLALANEPIDGTITLLEQWDGSAYTTVATDQYYVYGSMIFAESQGSWNTLSLTRFRATYNAGYTVDPNDSDVWDAPADIQQIVKLLVAFWFENREAEGDIPEAIMLLLRDHCRVAV